MSNARAAFRNEFRAFRLAAPAVTPQVATRIGHGLAFFGKPGILPLITHEDCETRPGDAQIAMRRLSVAFRRNSVKWSRAMGPVPLPR